MKKYLILLITIISYSIVFSQNEARWLRYPAVSPDGNTVVFTYKGDIYKVSSSGGDAVALTRNTAVEYSPVWSHDGKKIAFASNRHGNFDVFVMDADGSNVNRITYNSANEKPSDFSIDNSQIIFSASIQDRASNAMFPKAYLNELYSVPVSGGRIKQIFTTPAEDAKYSKDGKKIIYVDLKGPESRWRKHHSSSITSDVWIYDIKEKSHTKITKYIGEDRNPVFSNSGNEIYYLSENNGKNINLCKLNLSAGNEITNITNYTNHPARFISISNNGLICYAYDGDIYTLKEGGTPIKLNVKIKQQDGENNEKTITTSSGATDLAVSPDGKEMAFIVHGNVYVTSTEYSTTKQITDTPEEERSVSFSPDGKKILYASERNGSWNIYTAERAFETETNFALSTKIIEKSVIEIAEETFQPKFSPDGEEVAFLQERTELKVINLKSKEVRTILDGKLNYSYSDGDQYYEWSPDGKWFLVSYSPNMLFLNDVGLVSAEGKSQPINLTLSGYSDSSPKWVLDGKAMIWQTDRNGYRSHGSWGSYSDVYIMFFDDEAFNRFQLSKEELEILKEKEKKDKKKDKNDKKDTEKEDEEKGDDKKDEKEPIKLEIADVESRIVRLTINSSRISDAYLSKDGETLYYLTKFEKGFDLWENKIRENKTKLALKLSGYGGKIQSDKAGKNLFMYSGGSLIKINLSGFKKEPISFKAEYTFNEIKEREFMFEHVWRLMYKKFYKKNMHEKDWEYYKKEYSKFLPYINNNFDFAELCSEMLGELNASHTGMYYTGNGGGDKTGELGVFLDYDYSGEGLRIKEIIKKSPMYKTKDNITKGMIIEEINETKITAQTDFYKHLNNTVGKKTLLKIYNPENKERKEIVIEPISKEKLNRLLYERWVENRRTETEKFSKGKIGYVHVEGMNSKSYRTVYSDLLGRNWHKDAVIVDTRYNGGGWLHDDLATLLSGEKYVEFVPRGQAFGYDPLNKWVKPSAVLISEGNYSDAHAFPFVYKTLGIGKLIGMPVPGTMTAVWWEKQIDKTLVFGIPQIGARNIKGQLLENTQLEPDIKVENEYEVISAGKDSQIEKAVEHLLNITK